MTRYHASWLLPISAPPIRRGWVSIDSGRIVDVGSEESGAGAHRDARPSDAQGAVELGDIVLMPGLVNAHTHLELSYLRDRIPPGDDFVSWIRAVIAAQRQRSDASAAEILGAVEGAIAESLEAGTALVGDISNTLVTVAALEQSRLAAIVFYELIRFAAADADVFVEEACRRIDRLGGGHVRASLAAHAPYSVAPAVFQAIRAAVGRRPLRPYSVHLAESAAEVEFIRAGTGPWRALLEQVGAWEPSWQPPAVSPVEFLDEAGFLDHRALAVHGVQMQPDDLRRLAARGTWLVTCPRSNRFTGAGDPPIAQFYASGVRVAVGTDSLASTPDLNVFSELAAMRRLAPEVPAARMLESATLGGATALGFEADYGSIEPRKRAPLLAVRIPADLVDVEEYLLSGIDPGQVGWIE